MEDSVPASEFSKLVYRFRGIDRKTGDPVKDRRRDDELNALRRLSIWYCSLEGYNDPFELLYKPPPTEMEFGTYVSIFNETHQPKEHWDKLLLNFGICCFSRDVGNGPDNQLMWAHYAASHYGFAIGIRSVDVNGSPVDYVDCPHQWDDTVDQSNLDDRVINTLQQLSSIVFKKGKVWTYEDEFRSAIHGQANQLRVVPYRSIFFRSEDGR